MEQIVTSDFKLGIIAGGQLAKMLTQAASSWDINTWVLDPSPSCPAANTCTELVIGNFTAFEDVYEFGKNLDMITIELENINADALMKLKEEGVKVYPDPTTLKLVQDKGLQKQFYKKHDLPTAPFQLYESPDEIKEAVSTGNLKLPFVQKARKEGYDGRGVLVVKTVSDLDGLLPGKSLIEEKVDVVKEISVVVCRNTRGEIKSFTPVEMEFNPSANLVEFLICPANVDKNIQDKAINLATKVISALNIEGILAVEMFLAHNGDLLINEVAPRPHNSGHHTIESAFTSQYEQHLRAIFGFSLGSTEVKLPSIMVNILGSPGYEGSVRYEGIAECMAVEGVKMHIYGKKITKPYRKMGHATILDHDIEKAREKAKYIQEHLKVIS